MKESKFLGTLLPSHPDFLPIVEAIRDKYSLPEITPGDDPITEIFLGYEIIPLEEFRKDIERRLRSNLSFLPPDLQKAYGTASNYSPALLHQYIGQFDVLPDDLRGQLVAPLEETFKFLGNVLTLITQTVNPMIDSIVDMLAKYILLGEAEEIPTDWISKVATVTSMGEPMVMAMAGSMANLELLIQQFREEYIKTFGEYHPKITNNIANTAYYMQLQKAGKPWNYIVEEYIRLNKLSLPKKDSKNYLPTMQKYEARLKKRIQRSKAILDSRFKDKKD